MTPALILRSLENSLQPLIAAEKGKLDVSQTPQDTLALLCKSPGRWRCILQWDGHDGDEGTYGSSKRGSIAVIVQAAKGLQHDRGADVHRSRGGGAERPILELVPLINNWIRGIIFIDEEGELLTDVQTIKSKGRSQVFTEENGEWLEIEGVEVRQYQTIHSLRYADREIDDQVQSILVALETPIANILRAEKEGDGVAVEFSDESIRRIYMVYLNGQAVGSDEVSLDDSKATFNAPPQPGDTVMLLGAN